MAAAASNGCEDGKPGVLPVCRPEMVQHGGEIARGELRVVEQELVDAVEDQGGRLVAALVLDQVLVDGDQFLARPFALAGMIGKHLVDPGDPLGAKEVPERLRI